MRFNDEKVIQILVLGNYVTKEDALRSIQYGKARHTSSTDYLLTKHLITKDLIGQAIAEFLHVDYADLNSHQPQQDQVRKIPEEIARKYQVVIFEEENKKILFASSYPTQKGIKEALAQQFPGKEIKVAYSLPEDIDQAFINYRKPLQTRFNEIIKSEHRIAPDIIEEIFTDALVSRASDIHFEPQEQEVMVRFRVDGVLNEAGRIPRKFYENVLNRIKVLGRMRIDEHMEAQDGSAHMKLKEQEVDIRVSILPTVDGEKIVIRILPKYVRGFELADIGLSNRDESVLQRAADKPFGMIIVTGPTGSGKTTTLYTLLKILNSLEVNITTIENPVEYRIPGVNHIQTNKDTNLSFAEGLRSILRQDPDIIMVGEIRDVETAQIGVNAALTGHLLLSTFHANDAQSAIPRLLNMDIEPFLLASTLELVIAQRLVRRICDSCRFSYAETKKNLSALIPKVERFFPEERITLYRGKGCQTCGGSGYKGRVGIFELIPNSPELQDLILQTPSAKQVWELARTQGARSLFEDGMEKVRNGATTVEELLRVAPAD